MHCIIKTHRQKAWDDGVAPSVYDNCYPLRIGSYRATAYTGSSWVSQSLLQEIVGINLSRLVYQYDIP